MTRAAELQRVVPHAVFAPHPPPSSTLLTANVQSATGAISLHAFKRQISAFLNHLLGGHSHAGLNVVTSRIWVAIRVYSPLALDGFLCAPGECESALSTRDTVSPFLFWLNRVQRGSPSAGLILFHGERSDRLRNYLTLGFFLLEASL